MDVQDQELSDEYLSSLVDLTVNSKLLIDMLTTLAQENIGRGQVIVETIAQHIDKVAPDYKLPVLYLIDSILKNVGGEYKTLLSHSIVNIFCGAFEKVNEKIRHKMYLLRQTWSNDVFPASKLYMLDVKAHRIDGNWPIAPVPKPAIHVNPNFLKTKPDDEIQKLRLKERELLELKKRKLELELVATQKHIEQQEKALQMHTNSLIPGAPAKMMNQIAPLLCTPLLGSLHARQRIAPVNSALIASVRLRDPRIARQMHSTGQAKLLPRFPNPHLHSYGPRPFIRPVPDSNTPTTLDSESSARPKINVRPKIDKSLSSDRTKSRGSSSSVNRTERKDNKTSPRRADSKKISPRKSDMTRKILAADAKVSSTSDIEAKDSPIRASPVPFAKLDRKHSASPQPPPSISRICHEVVSVKVPTVTSTSDLASKETNMIGKKRLSQDHIETVNKKARNEKLDKLFGSEEADLRKEVMSLPRIPRRTPSATTIVDEPMKKPRMKPVLKKSFEKPTSRSLSDHSPTVVMPISDIQNMLTPISDEENDFSSNSGYERANPFFQSIDERKISDAGVPLHPDISKLSVPEDQSAPLSPMAQSLQIQQAVTPSPFQQSSPASSIAQEQLQKLQPSFNICIDGLLREVRFYGEVAVAFMGDQGSDPREIGFLAGQRRVLVNNTHKMALNFNDVYRPFVIGDDVLQIRFGTPIRELYINKQWYECSFGEPPAVIIVDGKQFLIQIEGPPPQIQIGHLRNDLVAGSVNMFIDTTNKVPLFLDCQLQYFVIDQHLHTIQFADYLLTVLIDGEVFPVVYGAMPKRIRIGGIEHHVRFSVLPNGIQAGHVSLVNMRRTGRPGVSTPPPVVIKPEVETPVLPQAVVPLPSLNIDDLLQQLVASGLLNSNSQGATVDEPEQIPIKSEKPKKTERLERSERSSEPKQPSSSAKLVDLSKTKSIKQRCCENIQVLFTGLQCASCGVRFPSEQAVKYSQHLDWHFRQNRRERELARRAQSRPWFYKVTDWIQYEEIENFDEREKNWFEQHANDADIGSDDSAGGSSQQQVPAEQPALIPSCVAGPSDTDKACDMCHDPFETFYNEDMEEWHLQNAIRSADSLTYHPACLHEMQAKEEASKNASVITDGFDDNAVDNEIGEAVEEHIILDDDVVEVPPTEEAITEILDEDDIAVTVKEETFPIKSSVCEELLTYEPIGDELDIQILVPHLDTLNLDEYEEKVLPVDEAAAELLPVKIKTEPIDKGYNDVEEEEDYEDVFEEVGILLAEIEEIEAANSSEQSQSDDRSESTSSPTPSPTPQITPMDGNVEPELETVQTVSTNKIKININKNVNKIVAKSTDKNTETLNEPSASGSERTPLAIVEEPEIVFDYKKSMEDISFQKTPMWTGGRDTSGLCSIM